MPGLHSCVTFLAVTHCWESIIIYNGTGDPSKFTAVLGIHHNLQQFEEYITFEYIECIQTEFVEKTGALNQKSHYGFDVGTSQVDESNSNETTVMSKGENS